METHAFKNIKDFISSSNEFILSTGNKLYVESSKTTEDLILASKNKDVKFVINDHDLKDSIINQELSYKSDSKNFMNRANMIYDAINDSRVDLDGQEANFLLSYLR